MLLLIFSFLFPDRPNELLLKSHQYEGDQVEEERIVETYHAEIGNSTKEACDIICDGFEVSAAASVDIYFIAVQRFKPILVPFIVKTPSGNLIFDEIELNPPIEDIAEESLDMKQDIEEMTNDAFGDYCAEVVPTFPSLSTTALLTLDVEVNETVAIRIKLTEQQKEMIHQGTLLCMGYKGNGERCTNLRKPGKHDHQVWCHHHKHQRTEFARLQSRGEMPISNPIWWEEES